MGSGGDQPYDYRNEIRTGLAQANTPKSPLAQTMNTQFMGAAPGVLQSMMNAQDLGNSMFGGMGNSYRTAWDQNSANFQGTPQSQTGNPIGNGNGGSNGGQQGTTVTGQNGQPVTFTPGNGGIWGQVPERPISDNFWGRAGGGSNITTDGGMQQSMAQPSFMTMLPADQGYTNAGSNVTTFGNPYNPGQYGGPGYGNPGGNQNPQGNGLGAFPATAQAGYVTQGIAGINQNQNAVNQLAANVQNPAMNFQNPMMDQGLMQRLNQPMGAQNVSGIGGLQQALQQSLQATGSQGNQANLQHLMGELNPQNSQFYQGVANQLQQKQQNDINDLRARFGAEGGTSRGTPAMFAEASLRAQQAPEIASALGQVGMQQGGMELQRRNQEMQALLQNAGLGVQNSANNVNQLGALLGAATQQRGQDVDLANNNLQAQLQQLGLAQQNAQGAGQLNLGQNQLASQNQLQAQGLQTDRSTAQLGQQNQFLSQLLPYLQGTRGQDIQNNQFNAGQQNAQNLTYAGMQQQGMENMLNRQFQGLQNLLSGMTSMGGAGMPGGSANINVSPMQAQQGSTMGGIGGMLGGLGTLIGAF